MKKFIILILISSITAGCATMFNGSSENILIKSDVKGAKLFLNNKLIGTDMASVRISKKNLSSAVLMAKKEGCSSQFTHINTMFDPLSLLGILLDGGLISIFIVDWAITGAIQEAERTNYILNPTCDKA